MFDRIRLMEFLATGRFLGRHWDSPFAVDIAIGCPLVGSCWRECTSPFGNNQEVCRAPASQAIPPFPWDACPSFPKVFKNGQTEGATFWHH